MKCLLTSVYFTSPVHLLWSFQTLHNNSERSWPSTSLHPSVSISQLPPVTTQSNMPSDAVSRLSYNDAVAKGDKLLKMMRAVFSHTSPDSPFLDQTSLQSWGYEREVTEYDYRSSGLRDSLRDVGVSCSGAGVQISDVHSVLTEHHGSEVPVSQAAFESIIERHNGLLIATGNYTPAYMNANAKWGYPDRPVPGLRHWSDIAYLQWMAPSLQDRPSDLKAIVRLGIENEDTMSVIDRVTAASGGEIQTNGLTWVMNNDVAKAMLGTPNGVGVAWLLAQHQKELGHKVVESVTLFWEKKYSGTEELKFCPSLVFHLKDAGVADEIGWLPKKRRAWWKPY